MGEETGGGNQGVSLHFEERGLVPAGALGWKAEKFWWDLLDFGGRLKIPIFLLFLCLIH